MIKKFLNDEKGQGMVEYILIIAVVAIAVIAAARLFGDKISDLFGTAADKVDEVNNDMR